jgi:hypothetical protein
MPPPLITLNVSGRKYITRPSTLYTSPYFTALLVRWDSSSDLQDDGSYFIDADADTFEYVLSFMRRPSKFPLYWSHEHGFDYVLYNKVEAEADFFLLHELRDWIKEKKYKKAVKTVVEVMVLKETDLEAFNMRGFIGTGDHVEITSFFGSYSGERRCRTACIHHNMYRRGCDSCQELVEKRGAQYDEPNKGLTLMIKKVVFDESVCRNDGNAD